MHTLKLLRAAFFVRRTVVKSLAHFAIIAFDNGDLSEIWHEIIFQRYLHDMIMRRTQ